MADRRPKDTHPAEDGDALWARVTRDVKPLAVRADRIDPPVPPPAPEKPTPVKPKSRRRAAAPSPPPAPAPPAAARDLSHGAAPGLDRRTQTNMRRGRLAVEARLDLHGMTQAEAHGELIAFLTRAYGRGLRCVLVITGKGTRDTGEVGVLRRAVPGWLNAPPLKDLIHAFDHAARAHGGEGALYILLKRNKARGDAPAGGAP
ncbi:MAG: hypothetical protein COW30_17095 [Rhodospirillales bacterium CG15_BIG_FIL_POST_REV_8_21_14_020_66_15]|nr:MAG: hypothetical protein COW30_17095 [Rhodospirillales bacterium CG15_BIG_FIL_POST_REV_8_21_14_020_66_15]